MESDPRVAFLDELTERRCEGNVIVRLIDAGDLGSVAAASGLSTDPAIYHAIDPEEAARLLTTLFHTGLVHHNLIMSVDEARQLADKVLALVVNARFVTNGSLGANPVGSRQSWGCREASSATFSTGLIGLGRHESFCVWVEEED